MRCTLEGETRMPRARSSRATRTLPHSGRSLASARTAERAAFAARVARRSAVVFILLVIAIVIVARGAADEIRFGVDVTAARVVRVLRIRAERARTARERVASGRSRADDALRRDAVLHPVHERREGGARARRRPPAAVVGARHQEEPREVLRLLEILTAFHAVIHLR